MNPELENAMLSLQYVCLLCNIPCGDHGAAVLHLHKNHRTVCERLHAVDTKQVISE